MEDRVSKRATIVIPGYPGVVLRAQAKPGKPVPEQPFRPTDGSENPANISNSDIVWPPYLYGLGSTSTALTKRLESKEIVPVCPIYDLSLLPFPNPFTYAFVGGELSSALDAIVSNSGLDPARHALGFGYDWRRDLVLAAESLARFIETYTEDADEVILVAHSTGGRVARYMLECMNFGPEAWFKKITHLVMVAVPNDGTAVSLAALVGIEVAPLIDPVETARIVNSDPYYCGLHQLLPHDGKTCAFEKKAAGAPKPVDIYTEAGAKKFGLNWGSVKKAIAFRDALAAGKRPKNVRYTRYHGDEIDTIVAVDKIGTSFSARHTDHGDGTVTKDSVLAGPKGDTPIALPRVAHHAMATNFRVTSDLRAAHGSALPAPGDFPLAATLAAPSAITTMALMPPKLVRPGVGFERCLPLILKHEGGYVDHPRDPGGATNLGITIGTLSRWLKRPATKAEVRALTAASVAPIYRAYYWLPVKGDDMPGGVDYALFDHAVNSGVGRAVRHLQEVLGVTVDGAIGGETMLAIGRQHPDFIVRALCDKRLEFLKGLPTWSTFGKGWQRRVDEVEDLALEMATGVPHGPAG
jgi:hypothetical protein